MINPYRGTTFFGFFVELMGRLWGFATGQLSWSDLASDELQLLVLAGIGVSGALVGTFLILRRMTMLANSVSHTILLGILVAYLILQGSRVQGLFQLNIGVLCLAALLTALLTTFLTQLLHSAFRLQEDAAIGLVFSTLFAAAILIATLCTRNVHLGAEVVMGSVDALHRDDLQLVGAILLGNVVCTALFYRFYRVTSFDPAFASSIGFSAVASSYLLMTQVSTTIIGGFRAVGVLMVLAFLVAPSLAARQFTHRLSYLLAIAAGISVLAASLGVATARHLLSVYDAPISTGGLVVCYLMVIFGVSVQLVGKMPWARKGARPENPEEGHGQSATVDEGSDGDGAHPCPGGLPSE